MWPAMQSVLCVVVIVITVQDSTSSRLLPGSSYSCSIHSLHALVDTAALGRPFSMNMC
jgi:hypothetical protein